MPESAEEIYARVVAQFGENGRLPMPSSGAWDIVPWESVDGAMAPEVLRPPVPEEHARNGEGDKPCRRSRAARTWTSWTIERHGAVWVE